MNNNITTNTLTFNPNTIQPGFLHGIKRLRKRPYIIENRLLRGYVSAIFSPGGVGKSAVELTKAISIAINVDLLGLGIKEQANVLVINNEDDEDELKRRIAGILKHYNIDPIKLKDRFFFFSGYESPLTIAKTDNNTVITSPDVAPLLGFIRRNDIGAVFIDPFISTHDISENDNNSIDKVISEYKSIASKTNAAISLTHHTRKSDFKDSEAHSGDAESGRGASSLKDAARVIETLARMSPRTAKSIDLDPDTAHRYIRLDSGKLNYGISDGEPLWFRMESVQIDNGDWVGVPKPVNLNPLFASSKSNKGIKWNAISAAEALERIIDGNQSVKWLDIREKFMDDNEVKQTQADNIRSHISGDKTAPTRITVNGTKIDYWTEKEHATAPVYIHRREVVEP